MPEAGRPLIVAGIVARALSVGEQCGLDPHRLLDEVGLDPAALEDRDNRVPVETFARLMQTIAGRCPDRVLALEWVTAWKPTDAGLMGYLLTHLKTVREGVETVGRFGHLVNQAASASLVVGPVTSRILHRLSPVLLATQHVPGASIGRAGVLGTWRRAPAARSCSIDGRRSSSSGGRRSPRAGCSRRPRRARSRPL